MAKLDTKSTTQLLTVALLTQQPSGGALDPAGVKVARQTELEFMESAGVPQIVPRTTIEPGTWSPCRQRTMGGNQQALLNPWIQCYICWVLESVQRCRNFLPILLRHLFGLERCREMLSRTSGALHACTKFYRGPAPRERNLGPGLSNRTWSLQENGGQLSFLGEEEDQSRQTR